MLKSLTAKAVCDALVDLFVNVGVPKGLVSDQGTNFTSQLTREMRFNIPGTQKRQVWLNASTKHVKIC